MAQTASAADEILKEFYVDKVAEAIKNQHPLSKYWKDRDDLPTDGRRVFYPVHVQRNSGRGARAESGNLPTAGQQAWQDWAIPYKFNHARIQLSAQALKQSKTSKGAFEKLFDAEIMGAAKDMGRDMNRQLFGYGNGKIADYLSGSGSTAIVLANGQGVADNDSRPARFFAENDIVAFVQADGTLTSVHTVSSVNAALTTLTLATAFTASSGDEFVVRASTTSDAIGSTAYDNEVMGLLGLIDDGTYVSTLHNVSRSSYPILNSYRLSSAGQLSLDMMQQCHDAVDQQGPGSIKCHVGHHTARREYLKLLTPMKRYINERAMNPDGGWKGAALSSDIEFNDKKFFVDRDCPYGTIFGLDDSYMFHYSLERGKWADEDGTVLLRTSGTDDYEARYRVFDNYHCDSPNTCFVIDGITISTPEAIQVI